MKAATYCAVLYLCYIHTILYRLHYVHIYMYAIQVRRAQARLLLLLVYCVHLLLSSLVGKQATLHIVITHACLHKMLAFAALWALACFIDDVMCYATVSIRTDCYCFQLCFWLCMYPLYVYDYSNNTRALVCAPSNKAVQVGDTPYACSTQNTNLMTLLSCTVHS
jgi:hypothetical protein